jgi:hypothetical protein
MPDLWLDVDVALSEVPVNIFPLIDDTDFKSIEGAIAYNAGGMALRWHFVTCAGAYTVTSVTPTTGGNYDWTDQGDAGIYTIEIPASGGASINNDTEGVGWFTGVATGVLPWRGPTIGFRRAALNDMFIEGSTASTNLEDFYDGTGYVGGTAKLTVDVTKIGGQTASAAGAVTVLASVGTAATATAQTGDCYPLLNTELADLITTVGAAGAGLTSANIGQAALVANNLDHLMKTATAGVDMTTEVTDGTVISRIISNSDTSLYVPSASNLTTVGADVAATHVHAAAADTKTASLTYTVANKVDANVYTWNGTAVSAPATAGIVEVNVKNIANAAVSTTTAQVGANIVQVSGDATAADNAEAFFDGTGYAGTNNVIPTVTTTGTATNLTNAPSNGDLTAAMKSSVNAEVIDVLRTDTIPDSYAAHEAQPTIAQAILEILQFLTEKAVSSTTVSVRKPDGSTAVMEFTLDSATAPTSITRKANP